MNACSVHLVAGAVMAPGEEPDVSFVPPLQRRRLSPLQKRFFALARRVKAPDDAACVFASRDGEDTLTRHTVADYRAEGTVSPARFSSSVYNAAPGLWSVFTCNRAPYTAIAADDETVECGLLEVLRLTEGNVLRADGRPVRDLLYVCAEETGGGGGAAAWFSVKPTAASRRVRVTAANRAAGSCASPPVSLADWCAFLSGTLPQIDGRYLSVRQHGQWTG